MTKGFDHILLPAGLIIAIMGCTPSLEPDFLAGHALGPSNASDAAAAATADAATDAAGAVSAGCGAVCAEGVDQESMVLCDAHDIWYLEEFGKSCLNGGNAAFQSALAEMREQLEQRVLIDPAWNRKRLHRYKRSVLDWNEKNIQRMCNDRGIQIYRISAREVEFLQENVKSSLMWAEYYPKIETCPPFE